MFRGAAGADVTIEILKCGSEVRARFGKDPPFKLIAVTVFRVRGQFGRRGIVAAVPCVGRDLNGKPERVTSFKFVAGGEDRHPGGQGEFSGSSPM